MRKWTKLSIVAAGRCAAVSMLVVFACLGGFTVSIPAQEEPLEPAVVGHIFDTNINSPHPYENPLDVTQIVFTAEVADPGTAFLTLYFINFSLGEGDFVMLTDIYGDADSLFNQDEYEFWSTSTWGDVVRIDLVAGPGSGGYGFDIDLFGSGDEMPDLQLFLDRDCDLTKFTDAGEDDDPGVCYMTYPDVAERLIFHATAFLVSDNDCVLTCRHNLIQGAGKPEFWFNYRKDVAAKDIDKYRSPGWTYMTNCDAAFLKLEKGKDGKRASQKYSKVEVTTDKPAVDSDVRITGHPAGNAKKISKGTAKADHANFPCDNLADLYSCKGNSGSPLINAGNDKAYGIFCGRLGELGYATKISKLPENWWPNCIQKEAPTLVEKTTWGHIKSIYR